MNYLALPFSPVVVDRFLDAGAWLESSVLTPATAALTTAIMPYATRYIPPSAWSYMASAQSFLAANRAPHSVGMPLMNGWHALVVVMAYLMVVFGGMAIMRVVIRRPLPVKWLANVHNAMMVWLSAYMCYHILDQAFRVRGYKVFVNEFEKEPRASRELAKFLWLFYFSKIFEFTDTCIMVAKMSFRQVSFLHVYHHGSIFVVWWLTTLVAPYGPAYFSAALNSFIHVVMYGYYLCSSLKIAMRVMAKIKPLITIMQMSQFTAMLVQSVYNIVDAKLWTPAAKQSKKYPFFLNVMLFLYMWTMLGLFANFFIQSYSKGKSASSSAGSQSPSNSGSPGKRRKWY